MPDKFKEIEIRSDEVQEILSYIPHWMIRWGITLIFGLVLMLVFLSWFIRYPDVVPGQITITTQQPPIRLVSRTDGYMAHLYHSDNSTIEKGELIAEITNPVSVKSIDTLEQFLEQCETQLLGQPKNHFPNISESKGSYPVLGLMQTPYNDLVAIMKELHLLSVDRFYADEMDVMDSQIRNNTALAKITEHQVTLVRGAVINAIEKFEADSMLYANGVSSKHQFFKDRTELTAKKQELAQLEKNLIKLGVSRGELHARKSRLIRDLELKGRELRVDAYKNIETIRNLIADWQQDFTITSPISGKLIFLADIAQNRFITGNAPLFAVVPDDQHYYGQLVISGNGYGKVSVGQKVRIKLVNYPSLEFGQLIGRVSEISIVPSHNDDMTSNEGRYLVKVSLPSDLRTTYFKVVTYTPEMRGTGEITTDDVRLLERVFNRFRTVLDN